MNFSSWDQKITKIRRNPALSPAHVIVEFDRTKKSRIFAHKLGNVNFSPSKDLDAIRNSTIEREQSFTSGGFKYKNIDHVYIEEEITSPDSNGMFTIYSHGYPLGGARAGKESCLEYGLQCRTGYGTDKLCTAGKCKIGTLQRIKSTKWRYQSSNTYGASNLPLRYYISGGSKVVLRTVMRGTHTTYTSSNASATIQINAPASITTNIYLPPRDYFSDDFLSSFIVTTNNKVDSREWKIVPDPDVPGASKFVRVVKPEIRRVEDRKSKFIRTILLGTYTTQSEGFINNRLYDTPEESVKTTLLRFFDGIDSIWMSRCSEIINEQFELTETTLTYLMNVYESIFELFGKIIQITPSSLNKSGLDFGKDVISRPIYSRLPGLNEAYRSDPSFSESETVAQWLTSGSDEFLSKKKEELSSFYFDYLNPETCNPANLDWLAQHLGLFGPLWNTLWDKNIKRSMINNAYGWWDTVSSVTTPALGEVLTPKGETLQKYPFTKQEWVGEPIAPSFAPTDNLLSIKLDEIGGVSISQSTGAIVPSNAIKYREFDNNKISLASTNQVLIRKELWNGLIESKGSLLGVAFLSSVFGLKAHTSSELEVIDLQRKIFRPKVGLRNAEINAPLLLPFKSDVIQVGTIADAKPINYVNQLVADVSKVTSVSESKNVFFRVPYYYNRDGKSWDRVSYLARWMPANLNVRVQYAYLSADLWAVGDAFFELNVTNVA